MKKLLLGMLLIVGSAIDASQRVKMSSPEMRNYVDTYNPNVDNDQTMNRLIKWKERINQIPRRHQSEYHYLVKKEKLANVNFGKALEDLTQSIEELVKASVDVKVYKMNHKKTPSKSHTTLDPVFADPNITSLGGSGQSQPTRQSDDIFKNPNQILRELKRSNDTTTPSSN